MSSGLLHEDRDFGLEVCGFRDKKTGEHKPCWGIGWKQEETGRTFVLITDSNSNLDQRYNSFTVFNARKEIIYKTGSLKELKKTKKADWVAAWEYLSDEVRPRLHKICEREGMDYFNPYDTQWFKTNWKAYCDYLEKNKEAIREKIEKIDRTDDYKY